MMKIRGKYNPLSHFVSGVDKKNTTTELKSKAEVQSLSPPVRENQARFCIFIRPCVCCVVFVYYPYVFHATALRINQLTIKGQREEQARLSAGKLPPLLSSHYPCSIPAASPAPHLSCRLLRRRNKPGEQ